MSSEEQEDPVRKALAQARAAAALVIDEKMREATLPAFKALLVQRDAADPHRFGSMIRWGIVLIGEDPMLDHLSVSRHVMRSWVEGPPPEGVLARVSIINRLIQLVDNRL